MQQEANGISETIMAESAFVDELKNELGRVIIGQERFLQRIIIGLLTGGHLLVEGVPGLAKTRAVTAVASCLQATFRRIQFTPDLLPADITGTTIFQAGAFKDRFGPIFANLVLADEINRAPAKVQSALLEAMQEQQVTIGETTHRLPEPFLVMATQNPIEQEGTYRLPEAQLDRFMMMVKVTYPSWEEERKILDMLIAPSGVGCRPIVNIEKIVQLRSLVQQIHIDDSIRDYIVNLVYATRSPEKFGAEVGTLIAQGASPRATVFLAKAAQGIAFLNHRSYVTPDDVKAILLDVLRHRVAVTYEAEAEEVTADDIVKRLAEKVAAP